MPHFQQQLSKFRFFKRYFPLCQRLPLREFETIKFAAASSNMRQYWHNGTDLTTPCVFERNSQKSAEIDGQNDLLNSWELRARTLKVAIES